MTRRLNAQGESIEPIWIVATSPNHPQSAHADVWEGPVNRVHQPSGAVALEVFGGDAANTAAGTGAREVTFIGLDESFNGTVVKVATNGLTPVAVPGTFFRINDFHVSAAGSYGFTEGGAMTVRTVSGANVLDILPVDKNVTKRGFHTVMAGRTREMFGFSAGLRVSKVNDSCFVELQVREPGGSAWFVVDLSRELTESNSVYTSGPYEYMTPGTDIRISAFTDQTGTDIRASLRTT